MEIRTLLHCGICQRWKRREEYIGKCMGKGKNYNKWTERHTWADNCGFKKTAGVKLNERSDIDRKEALAKYRTLVIRARSNPELPKSTHVMNQAIDLNEKWHFTEEERAGLPGAPVLLRRRHDDH